jgi:FlaA1/EpsC-like NDP-sugar epimerase
VARASGAEVVVLAISQAEPKFIQGLAERCSQAGLSLVVVPPVREMIAGRVELDKLREFNVADLLGRRPVETDLSEIADFVSGKVVLVTGAGGSIGSELSRQVRLLGPSRLVLLDRDESALHAVQLLLYGSGLLDSDDLVLCDIRDEDRARAGLRPPPPRRRLPRGGPQAPPHARALPRGGLEDQRRRHPQRARAGPGRRTPLRQHLDRQGRRRHERPGPDQAARRAAHRVVRRGDRPSVPLGPLRQRPRLAGSVLDAFRAQIGRGGPVTVTHPDVTRFFMTIPEACELVLQAGAIGQPGDVLVLDMGEPVRIVDVAHRLIDESRRDIAIEYTGLRQGEKLHEVLLSTHEVGTPSRHPLITQVSRAVGSNPSRCSSTTPPTTTSATSCSAR